MADSRKNKRSTMGDRAQALLIRMLHRLIPRLPLRASRFLSRALSSLLVRLLPRQRRAILGNLDVAFGGSMDRAAKRAVAVAMAGNMIKSFFECLYLASPFREKVQGMSAIRGAEHLDHALARGRGVIAVSAHFGNFINLGSFMVRAGYPFHMVLRDPESEPLARLFQLFRREAGQQWISTTPAAQCQRDILRRLRGNEIICIIADEYRRGWRMVGVGWLAWANGAPWLGGAQGTEGQLSTFVAFSPHRCSSTFPEASAGEGASAGTDPNTSSSTVRKSRGSGATSSTHAPVRGWRKRIA